MSLILFWFLFSILFCFTVIPININIHDKNLIIKVDRQKKMFPSKFDMCCYDMSDSDIKFQHCRLSGLKLELQGYFYQEFICLTT